MSEDSAQDSASTAPSRDAALRAVRDWYHVPALVLVFAYMLWVRVQKADVFTQNGEVLFSGNDAYYHYRQVVYTVNHWPQTMPFDPWTFFSYGTSVGQFGTLYDQIVATVALIIGAGAPTEYQAGLVLLYAPAVFGALTAIPAYFLGKRLGGRPAGIFSAVLLGLLPGLFLQRSLAGASDHNGAEPFFQAFAILGLMVSVALGDRHRPVLEQLLDRDYEGIATIAAWSMLAGVAVALYLWMWPPGVLIIGIFGVFVILKSISDFHSGISPDHLAVPTVFSMTTAGLLMLLPLGTTTLSPTQFSLIQPLLAFGVAFGSLFLAWLAREWEDRDFEQHYYGLAVVGILGAGVFVTTILLPEVYNLFVRQLLRIVAFGTTATAGTIGEAQPWMSRAARFRVDEFWVIFFEYGLAFHSALLAGLFLLIKPHLESRDFRRVGLVAAFLGVTVFLFVAPGVPAAIGGLIGVESALASLLIVSALMAAVIATGEYEGEQLLVVIWSAFMMSAAFTQIRFNYYLAVSVVALNGYLFGQIYQLLDVPSYREFADAVGELDYNRINSQFDTTQVLTIVLVIMVVLVPLVASPTVTSRNVKMSTAQGVGNNTSPGDFSNWQSSLQWMQNNTPEEGNWANANNHLDYYGTYDDTDDYDYEEGAYGVMSWWDYGHWITVKAQRIPNANPFQEGATTAANYLLAPSEERANEILEENDEDDAKTRYVMVDWQMIMPDSKFQAPIQFYSDSDVRRSDFYWYMYTQQNQQYQYLQTVKSQRYYESLMVRLYRYHGSAMQPQPIVIDWRTQPIPQLNTQIPVAANRSASIKQFDTMEQARAYVRNDSSSQIGGFSRYPGEYIPALQHYRLVAISEDQLAPANYIFNRDLQNLPTYVKTFERVPGAKVEGTGPANTTVVASVTMSVDAFNSTFTYQQRAETGPDGEFEMVLPYSTTGYENWGPENGHTNVSIRSAGPYEFSTGTRIEQDNQSLQLVRYNATTDVSEAQVIGEDDSTVNVELTRTEVERNQGQNQSENQSANALMSTEYPASATESSSSSLDGEPLSTAGPSLGALGALVVGFRRAIV